MRFPHVVLLSACALMWTATLLAQSPNGVINGLVVDPSNKVIAGAEILVMNDVTGVKYFDKTNDDGIYVVPNLPPGPYRLQVSKLGFKTLIKPDIVLNLQDALSINFTLPVGAAFETVTVEGGASMINTTDASVSTVVDQSYVRNMPLNGRSFQDLILLTPGVVTNSVQATGGNPGLGQSGEFSVNGQRTESNYYTVDGVSANVGSASGPEMGYAGASGSIAASTALGTTQALVSVDDLQEFRVQSSSYSAEYGRNPGGQFAFETKSGTNQWHGTAYDYLRNNYFDANDWFNDYFGSPEPALRQNDFGGTLGAPVRIPGLYNGTDKTFFFVSYEGLRLIQPQPASINYVPDATLRTSAPVDLQPVLNAFPLPNGPDDTANGFAQYVGTWSNPSSLDSMSIRFDHAVNDKLRLFFRFSDTSSSLSIRGAGATPSTDETNAYTLRTYTGGANSMFSNRLSNDFRFNYSSNGTTTSVGISAFDGSTGVNLANLLGLETGSETEVLFFLGTNVLTLDSLAASGAQKQWNFVDTLSLSTGRHQFKFGVDFRRLAPFAIPPSSRTLYLYFGQSSVEAGSGLMQIAALGPAHPLYTNSSFFVQDEWRASQRLNLSIGLRWELNPAPSVTQGPRPYTIQGSSPDTWTLAPQGTPLWQTTWFNFAPRLGVAYILHDAPSREAVLRAGGGAFFDTGQQLGSLGFIQGPGFDASTGFQPITSFPGNPAALLPIVNPPSPPYAIVAGFATHLQLPYTLQWNVSVEQALGKAQSVTLSYVGSHASRLLQENEYRPTNNAISSDFLLVQNGQTSDYNSLQFQFRRRFSRGLTVLASYTWSHCLDYGSSNFVFGYQRGNCDFDVRDNLSTAVSYDLPNLGNGGFVDRVLHHWGLDDRFTARTAFPVTLVGNELPQPNGQIYDGGLSFVPGQPTYLDGADCASVLQGLGDLLPGQGCPGGRAINPNAFTAVNSGLGDTPRNFARGFNAVQVDMAIRRDFPIYENLKLQFRAEAFNILNHPNFGTINPYFGQPTFGQATGTLANSLGVLSPLYQMGGPRSMQFALKLVF